MKIPTISSELIEGLRSWFFAKDRSVYLAAGCLAYLNNGAYLSVAFIAETVLSASAATVAFSNIPQGFRSLMLIYNARTDRAAEADNAVIRFNGDSGANYDVEGVVANGAVATITPTRATATPSLTGTEAANSRAFNFSPAWVLIPNYNSNTAEKQYFGLSGIFGNLSADTDLFAIFRTAHWRNTNVITSITLSPAIGPNFVSGSNFQLYGIL